MLMNSSATLQIMSLAMKFGTKLLSFLLTQSRSEELRYVRLFDQQHQEIGKVMTSTVSKTKRSEIVKNKRTSRLIYLITYPFTSKNDIFTF